VGRRVYDLAAELYPICRSITGSRHIDIDVTEVPSGTEAIPREWSIADAYIADAAGERVVVFAPRTCTSSTIAGRFAPSCRSSS
jgi:aminopeptidase-like protein